MYHRNHMVIMARTARPYRPCVSSCMALPGSSSSVRRVPSGPPESRCRGRHEVYRVEALLHPPALCPACLDVAVLDHPSGGPRQPHPEQPARQPDERADGEQDPPADIEMRYQGEGYERRDGLANDADHEHRDRDTASPRGRRELPTYVDARLRAAPTPMPVRNRHSDSETIPVANAVPRDPKPETSSEVRNASLRPRQSASAPMRFDPTM